MGTVWRASHLHLPRQYAVKMLDPSWSMEDRVRQRFESEAKIIASLQHPNIIQCFDYGYTTQGTPFIVLELLEGETLAARLKRQDRLTLGEAANIFEQLTNGLGAAHAQGVIHRDIKPDNIFLVHRPEGDLVKLLDFGIARIIGTARITSAVIGTPYFMSPEQVGGNAVEPDIRSDIFSLGSVLYLSLTGKAPFNGDSAVEVISAVCLHHPPPPSEICSEVHETMSQVVMKALAKDREQRYPNVEAFWDEFRPACIPPTRPIFKLEPKLVLRCEIGEKPGELYTVTTERAMIGRADKKQGITPEVDLDPQERKQPHPTISRQHAEIAMGPDGFRVVDLGSHNGSWVNDVQLKKGRPQILKKGDRLKVGIIVLLVEEVVLP
jgi:serine/threonine-protein kinase